MATLALSIEHVVYPNRPEDDVFRVLVIDVDDRCILDIAQNPELAVLAGWLSTRDYVHDVTMVQTGRRLGHYESPDEITPWEAAECCMVTVTDHSFHDGH